ncbi:hypothetical protein LX32DRAFT_68549 [Colletotrichum zoysiae]|uniref:Uncharacterized protein n=1 Tax=Colletotrichum zoysiae TaxID=1216348 RepID=A0AAD9HB62_9PEZI|nr:hypothetical protein LX32DRAFT_68549 [Colletotrichum zoysiae]
MGFLRQASIFWAIRLQLGTIPAYLERRRLLFRSLRFSVWRLTRISTIGKLGTGSSALMNLAGPTTRPCLLSLFWTAAHGVCVLTTVIS